jgi:hypothetical protein
MRNVASVRSLHPGASARKLQLARQLSRGRWGAAMMAATALAGATMAATAIPAHAVTINYSCGSGSYKSGLGRLGAFDCSGSGTTDVFVAVSDLDVSGGGPQDFPATLYCTDFAPSGVPGHWSGDCSIYSTP